VDTKPESDDRVSVLIIEAGFYMTLFDLNVSLAMRSIMLWTIVSRSS